MGFRTAYDTRTGRKLAHPVPEHWFGHPVLGANLRKTPRGERAERQSTQTTKAPAAGDEKE